MSRRPPRGRTSDILDSMKAQGARIKETKNGWMILCPDGTAITVHGSESDRMAEQATRSRVMRAGLKWPFDGENR